MPAPGWFFRFMYDRESSAWARQRYEPSLTLALKFARVFRRPTDAIFTLGEPT